MQVRKLKMKVRVRKKERKKERKSKKVRKLKMLQAAPPYTTMEVMTIGPKRAILKRKQVLKELS